MYWLQPKGGTVDQQEACICVNGKFYALNCKFEKAIFRSVRLTRDFQNYERLVDGTRKLVIPRRLFQEKLKTSRRVRVCGPCSVAPASSFSRHVSLHCSTIHALMSCSIGFLGVSSNTTTAKLIKPYTPPLTPSLHLSPTLLPSFRLEP